jgi:hypothetical protein
MAWCTIESDPGVFTELISMLGVKDVAVEEIYSFDATAEKKESSYGLIFLFKWQEEFDDREMFDPSVIPELFFPRQIVQNGLNDKLYFFLSLLIQICSVCHTSVAISTIQCGGC